MNNLQQDVQAIWDALTPEDIEYAAKHYTSQTGPFGTLGDIMDHNMLYPDNTSEMSFEDSLQDDSEWIKYLNQVAAEFDRQFVAKYPR